MSFLSNARTMIGGFAVAQAIPIAAAPLLARLYSPEAFGLQTLFMSATSVLIVLATLRLDLAILLAEGDEEGELVGIIGLLSLCVMALVAFLIIVFGPTIAERTARSGQYMWMWLLLPMIAAGVFVQVATALLTRTRDYRPIAATSVVNQLSYALVSVAASAVSAAQGMVVGKAAGQIAGAIFIGSRSVSTVVEKVRFARVSRTKWLWKRFNQFVVFNAPYSLIGAVSREMPIYIFSAMSATAAAGYYGLARMLLSVPNLLASAALSQVFYREAVEHRGTKRLETFTTALLSLTMRGSAPLFAFACVWGDLVFATIFGATWTEAGVYAMILAPAAWLALQTGWPERLFEAALRQDVSFRVQIGFDLLTVVAVAMPVVLGAEPIYAVVAFAIVNSAYHISYLVAVFSVSGFALMRLRLLLVQGVSILVVSVALLALVRFLVAPAFLAASACVLPPLVAATILVRRDMRRVVDISASETVA